MCIDDKMLFTGEACGESSGDDDTKHYGDEASDGSTWQNEGKALQLLLSLECVLMMLLFTEEGCGESSGDDGSTYYGYEDSSTWWKDLEIEGN